MELEVKVFYGIILTLIGVASYTILRLFFEDLALILEISEILLWIDFLLFLILVFLILYRLSEYLKMK